MEQKPKQLRSKRETEQELLPIHSQALMTIITNKEIGGIKRTAVELAPGGRPNFDLIFQEGRTQQLSVWNRIHGKKEITKLVLVLVEDLNNYFNVARPMNAGQMTDLAIELVETLWWVRFEEILAFFESVKKQNYGKIYERLDPAIIWEHWELYALEREKHFENNAMQFKQSDPRERDSDGAIIATKGVSVAGLIGDIKNRLKN